MPEVVPLRNMSLSSPTNFYSKNPLVHHGWGDSNPGPPTKEESEMSVEQYAQLASLFLMNAYCFVLI